MQLFLQFCQILFLNGLIFVIFYIRSKRGIGTRHHSSAISPNSICRRRAPGGGIFFIFFYHHKYNYKSASATKTTATIFVRINIIIATTTSHHGIISIARCITSLLTSRELSRCNLRYIGYCIGIHTTFAEGRCRVSRRWDTN